MIQVDDKKALEAFVSHNPELERLEAELAKFNIFEAIGVVRQELRHSDFLAFLLNPAQNHGLSDLFLKRLLMRALSDAENAPFSLIQIDSSDLRQANVLREWQNIDILLTEERMKLVVAIENKVDSSEHSNQLARYRQTVQRQYSGYRHLFVFLTPDDLPPVEDEDRQTYVTLSYGTVANVLESLLEGRASGLNSDVGLLIRHYVTMLRRHIVSDSEIADFCRQIYQKHQRALDLIFEHRPDLQLEILEYLLSLIQGETELIKDNLTKNYINFLPRSWDNIPVLGYGTEQWGKRILRFYFENWPSSLTLKLLIYPGPQQVREGILQAALENKQVFRRVNDRRTDKFKTIYNFRMLNQGDFDGARLDDLAPKINELWQRFLTHDLPEIRQVIEQEIDWADLESQIKG